MIRELPELIERARQLGPARIAVVEAHDPDVLESLGAGRAAGTRHPDSGRHAGEDRGLRQRRSGMRIPKPDALVRDRQRGGVRPPGHRSGPRRQGRLPDEGQGHDRHAHPRHRRSRARPAHGQSAQPGHRLPGAAPEAADAHDRRGDQHRPDPRPEGRHHPQRHHGGARPRPSGAERRAADGARVRQSRHARHGRRRGAGRHAPPRADHGRLSRRARSRSTSR